MQERILIIEDEPKVAAVLRGALGEAGYVPEVVGTAARGIEKIEAKDHALVLLDLMLPDLDGFEVLRRTRGSLACPVLILTAKGSVPDRVDGLDLGADDYIVKPFILEELLARIRASLRRSREHSTTQDFGDLHLDLRTRKGTRGGNPLYLSTTEFVLLELLVRHQNRIVSKVEILREIWDDEAGYRQRNLVEVNINALRQKTERFGASRIIHTIRGQGYIVEDRQKA